MTGSDPWQAAVRLVDVVKTHRRGSEVIHAVDGVTMTLRGGEMVALVGPSGSGKSTLADLIAGWQLPDSGEITLDGGRHWADMAIVPQHLGMMPELSVGENIGLPARLGSVQSEDIGALSVQLGIEDLLDRRVEDISLGEQQRAAVGRALILGSKVIIADEPTSHLDEEAAALVGGLLAAAARRGSAVLVLTHDHRLVGLADRTLDMLDGRLTTEASPI
jgi:putative ABC transport system ATP-binding protein